MNRIIVSCSLGLLLVALGLTACQKQRPMEERSTAAPEAQANDQRGYDPLEFPEDLAVLPRVAPQAGVIGGDKLGSPDSAQSDSLVPPVKNVLSQDTLASQVYRIQLATADVYGEARAAVLVAEEIFDQPVFVDYEVPYFKVRVGRFVNRDAAEAYQKRAVAVGYENAWVVLVNVNVKRAPLLYDELPDSLKREEVPDSTASPDDES